MQPRVCRTREGSQRAFIADLRGTLAEWGNIRELLVGWREGSWDGITDEVALVMKVIGGSF